MREALVLFWEASDRVCGKRLRAMLPIRCLAAVRPRSSACVTPPRSCARSVLCRPAFPLAHRPWLHRLRSIDGTRRIRIVRRLHSYYGGV